MKNIFLVLALCLPVALLAQKSSKIDKKLKYLLEVFEANDKDFQISEAPEEFKEDPVVILCQKMYLTFERGKKGGFPDNTKKGAIRKRIIIQDKSAIDYYSEYYFKKANQANITIVKPDGSSQEIDFDAAVAVTTEVPKHYRNNYSSGKYYKIAIPNLEVGDIVDSYQVFSEKFFTDYTSNIYTIAESFPIIHQEFIYDISDKWTFYVSGFNGAPEVVESDQKGLNKKGKVSSEVIRYTLVDKNTKAQEYERWDFPFLSEPTVKYMVADIKSAFGDKSISKRSTIDFDESIGPYLRSSGSYLQMFTSTINKTFETKHIKKLPTEKKVTQIYNVVKYFLLQGMIGFAKQEEIKAGNVFPFSQEHHQFRSDLFSLIFANMLKKYKVKHDLVVIVPKQYGFPEDVVSADELVFGVYVPSVGRYYWVPDNYTLAGEFSSTAFGASGYKILSKDLKFKKIKLIPIELPESKPEENAIVTNLTITIEEDNTLTFDNTTQYSGSFKEDYSPFLLYNTAYAYEDIYNLRSKNDKKRLEVFNEKKKFKKKDWRAKRYAKKRKELEDELAEYEEKKFEYIKSWIESDFEVKDINTFEINTFGNESLTTPLECTMNFSSDSYLKKAGPNLIFDIGSLITSQIQLDKEEIEKRQKPIEIYSSKTISNAISITIPDGLSVEGLENLEYNVDNEAASFVSSAVQEGNVIKLNTSKVYKQEFLEVTMWPKLVEMLEAAYQFTQQKVVMKKK